ncbi:MAG: Uma2 family endonuclease [Chitinophagaceae bacterium]|nr:Uma2 family endonuclease [Chitinophagaceae bacterium]
MGKLTIYNVDDDSYSKVEEPDPSVSYTYADYLQWKFEERMELFRGKIFLLSAPNRKHQLVSANLTAMTVNFLKGKNCHAYPAPFDVRLPVKNRKKDNEVTTVVQPDLCVICDETKLDDRGCCGAPDLAVEILSPGNSYKEVRLKHELYEEAGVKEYWLVYPGEESVAVFLLNENNKYGGAAIYAASDKIASTAVQGLSINVRELFSN